MTPTHVPIGELLVPRFSRSVLGPSGYMAVGQNRWYHVGVGAPPILEPILVGIGMFTGGTGF